MLSTTWHAHPQQSSRPRITWVLALLMGLSLTLPVNAEPNSASDWLYSVRPNETLGSISDAYLDPRHSWHELVRYNQLAQPAQLAPGTVIRIPVAWLKQQPAPATAVTVQGDVLVRRAQQPQLQPLRNGQALNVGDEVQSRQGTVSIRFADGSSLRLNENSRLLFNTLTRFGDSGMVDTRTRLLKGDLSTTVQPLQGSKSRYEIATPSAVAAVRGTRFRLQATDSSTQLEVAEGVVQLESNLRHEAVRAGFGTRTGGSTATREAVRLLPAPQLGQPLQLLEQLPHSIDWQPVPEARQYVAELYADNDLGPRLRRQQSTQAQLQLDQLNNGQYLLALRAVDGQGFQGQIQNVAFEVKLQSLPAQLIAPGSQAVLAPEAARFNWAFQRDGDLASLQIAATADFQDVLAQSPFSPATETGIPSGLEPGHYFWRVATRAGGTSYSHSDVRPFTLLGILPETRIVAVQYRQDQARLYWTRLTETDRFLVQVARDPAFTEILREERVQGTQANIKLPDQEVYYARVRGIASELYRSEFGPGREIALP